MDVLIVPVLIVVAGYVMACVVWPFTACRRCEGTGKHRSPSGRAWRECRRCEGSGRRVRVGRRVWETARYGARRDD